MDKIRNGMEAGSWNTLLFHVNCAMDHLLVVENEADNLHEAVLAQEARGTRMNLIDARDDINARLEEYEERS